MTCTYFRIIIHSTAYHHLQITWLSYFGSENQGLPLRSWFVTCWLWRHIPIVTSLAVPSSCVVTQTPMGTNSGTRHRKRKFPLLFVNCDRGRIEIRCAGRATAGTTRAVPDCSTNHSSTDRIVVNSYNNALKWWPCRGPPPPHAPCVLGSVHLYYRLYLENVIQIYWKMLFCKTFCGKYWHNPSKMCMTIF